MQLLDYTNFYLIGIKGVAMTSMVQLLLDAGKTVSGCDVAEEFVTQKILNNKKVVIDVGFKHDIPKSVDCVIFTAAHNGKFNPMVVQAQEKGITTYSHALAQADLFNTKKGIAVCGVGGKSTVSAMIAWIFEKTNTPISYAVGVGNIPGLEKTAQWNDSSEYFVAEADEYVTDPSAPKRNEEITPRFSFLQPHITVCTNLKFDHPDVYTDFEHTKSVFESFFSQIDSNGILIQNISDLPHDLSTSAGTNLSFGKNPKADFSYTFDISQQKPGKTVAYIVHKEKQYILELQIPGEFNVQNALSAIAGAYSVGISIEKSVNALATFASTQRRFEFHGNKNGVLYYDDYAHHPNEIKSAIAALNAWYPENRKIIIFQPHTYSRTKQLMHEFTHAFKQASEVYLLDIFASAREELDPNTTTDQLKEKIQNLYPEINIKNLKNISSLATFLQQNTHENDVVLTLGAGDIYKVHDKIK